MSPTDDPAEMSDERLALRLRAVVHNPTIFNERQRRAIVLEAATRLEKINEQQTSRKREAPTMTTHAHTRIELTR